MISIITKAVNGLQSLLLCVALPFIMLGNSGISQPLWHNKERKLHYRPQGVAFIKVQGERRFNRALYGTNTAFRAEAGDLPEFALYLPGMGGNIKMGIEIAGQAKWLTEADSIETRYLPGKMQYVIRDALCKKGALQIELLAMADADGLLIRTKAINTPKGLQLLLAYGGVSGKKFSRDGDIGADPESVFEAQPSNCEGNSFKYNGPAFVVMFNGGKDSVQGYTSGQVQWKVANVQKLSNAAMLWQSPGAISHPVLVGRMPLYSRQTVYCAWQHGANNKATTAAMLADWWQQAEGAVEAMAARIQVHTPDAWLNTLGPALAFAADAIWEAPTYLHGAVAWRMRLPAWRGAYAANTLGWHERAHQHFESYAKSQVLTPAQAPVEMDTALHLARHVERIGTAMFSQGYICRNPNGDIRPHHYDMNLVFIDQLFTHFNYTADTAFARQMWPLITRHLAWEKRNFDTDDDGLYDAYCCIWASDALQYSGGGVTHSTAYNYRAFTLAAQLATLLGYNAQPYRLEAQKIANALRQRLWLADKGWFAEYVDVLGNKLQHTQPGAWTIYHALDAGICTPFEAWQLAQYVHHHLPRIPVQVQGLPTGLHLYSTTNWMPYTWSVNNVALAENLHTSLGLWQAAQAEPAFMLWKSALLETMYAGASPGGFQQLSFYDAMRGQLYRDFADPIGMAARSLTEGLFGICPDYLNNTLVVQPGFPHNWPFARLSTPNIYFDFKTKGTTHHYTIHQRSNKAAKLHLRLPALGTQLPYVQVNGKPVTPFFDTAAVGKPFMVITAPADTIHNLVVTWSAGRFKAPATFTLKALQHEMLTLPLPGVQILQVYDPQGLGKQQVTLATTLNLQVERPAGIYTVFVKCKQQQAIWWQPVQVQVLPPIENVTCSAEGKGGSATLQWKLNCNQAIAAVTLNGKPITGRLTRDKASTCTVEVPTTNLVPGTNTLQCLLRDGAAFSTRFLQWDYWVNIKDVKSINISSHFNASIADIFQQSYVSPRPTGPTLQLPTHGFGNWCYPLAMPVISDSGMRQVAKQAGHKLQLANGLYFATPGQLDVPNISFVSQWHNFPDSLRIPVQARGSHAYLLMAGTTNPMQSRMANGVIYFEYGNGSRDSLLLVNPENWWPIEQDYYEDGFAFSRATPLPPRIDLASGQMRTQRLKKYDTIKGVTSYAISGGAATIVDMPLKPDTYLQQITIKALANDVVVGLMGITLLQ